MRWTWQEGPRWPPRLAPAPARRSPARPLLTRSTAATATMSSTASPGPTSSTARAATTRSGTGPATTGSTAAAGSTPLATPAPPAATTTSCWAGPATTRSHYSQAGHDFWLTRNRHGAGFWDRGLGDLSNRLSDASKVYGEVDLYVGDDGQIYA